MSIEDSALANVLGQELVKQLATIRMMAQLGDAQSSSAGQDYYQQISALASQTIDLVEATLTLKANRSLRTVPQPVGLASIAQQVVDKLQPSFADNNQLVKVYQRPLTPVYSQRDYAYQVLDSVLSHAAEYSSPGQPIEVRFRDYGDQQSVRIRDYGSLLSAKEWQRLAEPSFGTRAQPFRMNPGASGLQLYISRQLSEQLGGSLELLPKRVGNCIEFKLPALYQPQIWQAHQW